MPRVLLYCLLLLTADGLPAQNKTQPKQNPTTAASQSEVAPDDFVVLISGACEAKPQEFSVRGCVRGITRQEFEALLAIEGTGAFTPQARQKFAENLAQIIILSNEARKRDLPKEDSVKQYLRFVEMQALANLLVSQSAKKAAGSVTDGQIDAYYREHGSEFTAATLTRIQIPLHTAGVPSEEEKALAASLRTRCTAGEDPVKLQAEANQKANIPVTPPATIRATRSSLVAEQQTVFNLKPGECSGPYSQAAEITIYKVNSFLPLPLAEVRKQVVDRLSADQLHVDLEQLKKQNVIKLNGRYFGSGDPSSKSEQK